MIIIRIRHWITSWAYQHRGIVGVGGFHRWLTQTVHRRAGHTIDWVHRYGMDYQVCSCHVVWTQPIDDPAYRSGQLAIIRRVAAMAANR